MSRLFSPLRTTSRRAFTLLEMTLALGLSGIVLAGVWQTTLMVGAVPQANGLKGQCYIVAQGVRQYLNFRRAELLAALPAIDDAGELLVSDLQDLGYIDPDFTDNNAYDQTHRIFVRREDTGYPGADDKDALVAVVVTDGGEPISERIANQLLDVFGLSGGFIYPEDPDVIRGTSGSWSLDFTDAGWSSIAGYTPSEGHVAVLVNLIPSRMDGDVGGGGGAESIDDLSDGVTDYSVGNVFLGDTSEHAGGGGSNVTSFGLGAMVSHSASNLTTAIGRNAATSETSGDGNTAVGSGSFSTNVSGDYNTAVGYNSLATSTGNANTAVGSAGLKSLSMGDSNVAFGNYTTYNLTSGSQNTVLGSSSYPAATSGTANTILGATSGQGLSSGSNNTLLGIADLNGNTSNSVGFGIGSLYQASGAGNTAVGMSTLYAALTSGAYNTTLGVGGLYYTASGAANTSMGYYGGFGVRNGSYNTYLSTSSVTATFSDASANTGAGYQSIRNITNGQRNTAMGVQALYSNQMGSDNTAIGSGSLYLNRGSGNTAIGYQSAISNNTGNYNTAVGDNALYSNQNALYNLAVGTGALASQNGVNGSTAVGYGALFTNPNGQMNTAIGAAALQLGTSGSYNTAFGVCTCQECAGSYNVAFGAGVNRYLTGSSYNTAFGYVGMQNGSTTTRNTLAGFWALGYLETGTDNVGIGDSALVTNTDGSYNTVLGFQAGYTPSSVNRTTLVGFQTMALANTTADDNTLVGEMAGSVITTGGQNTSAGIGSLWYTTEGVGNTALGFQTGAINTTGNYNVWLGRDSYPDTGGYSNSITLSTALYIYGSNRIILGNNSTSTLYGQVALTVTSDRRYKKDIEALGSGLGLDFVRSIRPIRYRLKDDESGRLHFGVIAQELEQALPLAYREIALSENHNGLSLVSRAEKGERYYHVNYTELVAPVVKAVQELHTGSDKVDRQVMRAEELAGRQDEALENLSAQIEAVSRAMQQRTGDRP